MTSASARLFRPVAFALVLLALVAASGNVPRAHAGGVLVSYEDAARHGLERAWFAQAPIDPSRSRASTWYLYYDCLYCVSDSGIVSAFNAETGAMLWSRRIGGSGLAAFGPGANAKYLGVVSGSHLYLLNRETGRLKWMRDLGGAPSTGPALSKDYAYVALATGRIEGYKVEDSKAQPWYYQSKGRTYFRPTTTGTVVSWPTSEGYLYVSRADNPGILYRLATGADIVTSPAELDPYLYIASLDGYLYCLNEQSGKEMWRYTTGYPVMSSPAIVGKHAYVASIEPSLHCLDSTTGALQWSVTGVSNFAAEGRAHIYASDKYGNLIVLDPKTGGIVGQMKTAEGITTLVNDQTDRIFLVNELGLVQCLREIGAEEPVLYRQDEATAAAEKAAAEAAGKGGKAATGAPLETPPAGAPPAEAAPAEESPFETEPPAAAPPAAKGAAEEAPAAEDEPAEGAADNPFGEQ